MITIKNAVEFLERYPKVKREIDDLEERIKTIRAKYSSAKAIVYSDMPKSSGTSDLSDYMVKLEEYADKLIDKLKTQLGIEVDIMMTLEELKDLDESYVLRRHYIDGKKWETIAGEIPCSERQVYIIRSSALKNLAKTMQTNAENNVVE